MTRRALLGPLGARLALAFAAVAVTAIAVLGALTLAAARSEVADLVDRRQRTGAEEIAAALAQAYDDAGGWEAAGLDAAFALAAAARAELVVLDARGELVGTPPPAMDQLMARMHGGMGAVGEAELGTPRRVDVTVGGTRVGTASLRFPESALPAPERQVRDALVRTVVTGAALATLVAVAAAVFVSRRVTQPLVALTAAARRLGGGERDARAGLPDAPGELGELSVAFDEMADALHREDELRRNLVADVAHELRTPVTILRAACEEMVDGLAEPTGERLASLHDEVLRLGRVVEDLGALAAAEAAGLRLEREVVDLASIAAGAVDLLRPRFAENGLRLETRLEPVLVDGDAARLHQLTVNLLTNALKFTPEGGTVTVHVLPSGSFAQLEVSDTGPGIDAEELPHVFERFWRGRAARAQAGSGIGLAVVAELARAHGGRAEARSRPGNGASFRVLLPRA